MREWGSYIMAGAFGVAALGAAVVTGYWNAHPAVQRTAKATVGSPLTKRQALERRRARAADVAIAGTTTT